MTINRIKGETFTFPSVWSEGAFLDLRREILNNPISVGIYTGLASDANYIMEHMRDLFARYAHVWTNERVFVQNYVNSVITETETSTDILDEPYDSAAIHLMWSKWALKLRMFAIGA